MVSACSRRAKTDLLVFATATVTVGAGPARSVTFDSKNSSQASRAQILKKSFVMLASSSATGVKD